MVRTFIDGARCVLLAIAISVTGLWMMSPARPADAGAASSAVESGPIFFGTQDHGPKTLAGVAALRQKARTNGDVRVIAGLRMAMRNERQLAPDRAALQARQLLQLQQAVARRVLGRSTGDDIIAFPYLPYMSLFVGAIELDRLLDDPDVVSVEEDVPAAPADAQSNALVHSASVWNKGDTGHGYTIAILDSGVDAQHPALAGKVVAEACYSTNYSMDGIPIARSFCPGGGPASTAPNSGVNCPYPKVYDCEHGTLVASIAAGREPLGVATGATIISIQVYSELYTKEACPKDHSPCAKSYISNQISALMQVLTLSSQYKIAAVNMSLEQGLYEAACNTKGVLAVEAVAVERLREAGIATVAAAGNFSGVGEISAPSCLSNTLAVANGDQDFQTDVEYINPGSDYSSLVKLVAPGTEIMGAIPGGGIAPATGTSFAAPQVAGAFALLKAAKPTADVGEIATALACTGKPIGGLGEGKMPVWRPRIDLLGAYSYLKNPGAAKRSWNFSNPQQAFDWLSLGGEWLVKDRKFVVTPILPGAVTMTADPNNSLPVDFPPDPKTTCRGDSFTLEATMTRIYPQEPKATVTFPGSCVFFNYAFLEATGYEFCYTYYNNRPDNVAGVISVARLDGFSGSAELCLENEGPLFHFIVNNNSPNVLEVISQADAFKFSINGTPVCKDIKPDHTYLTGAIAVGTTFLKTEDNSFSVSHVSVLSPTPTPPSLGANDTIDPVVFPAVHAKRDVAVEPTPFGVVYVTH